MGKFSKYLNKVVDSSMTVGITSTGVGVPIAKGAGKITGELVEGLINEYEKSKQHKEGKLAEHLLTTFEPDDPKWISFLLDNFSTIFLRYVINFSLTIKMFDIQICRIQKMLSMLT